MKLVRFASKLLTMVLLVLVACGHQPDSPIVTVSASQQITVNYDLPLEQAITADTFDWKKLCVTANDFPTHDRGEHGLSTVLIHFNRIMSTNDVINEMDKRGLRPATIRELAAFGQNMLGESHSYSIIGLGSVVKPHEGGLVPYMDLNGRSELDLVWLVDWGAGCRFLAVRKT